MGTGGALNPLLSLSLPSPLPPFCPRGSLQDPCAPWWRTCSPRNLMRTTLHQARKPPARRTQGGIPGARPVGRSGHGGTGMGKREPTREPCLGIEGAWGPPSSQCWGAWLRSGGGAATPGRVPSSPEKGAEVVASSLTWAQAYASGAWFLCSWPRQGSFPRWPALGWDTLRTVLGPEDTPGGSSCGLGKGHVAFHPSGVSRDTSSGHPWPGSVPTSGLAVHAGLGPRPWGWADSGSAAQSGSSLFFQ